MGSSGSGKSGSPGRSSDGGLCSVRGPSPDVPLPPPLKNALSRSSPNASDGMSGASSVRRSGFSLFGSNAGALISNGSPPPLNEGSGAIVVLTVAGWDNSWRARERKSPNPRLTSAAFFLGSSSLPGDPSKDDISCSWPGMSACMTLLPKSF